MDAADWMTPPAPLLVETPVLLMSRAEPTLLVLLPLKRLLASTPLREKLLLVSRWPLRLSPFAEIESPVGASRSGRLSYRHRCFPSSKL